MTDDTANDRLEATQPIGTGPSRGRHRRNGDATWTPRTPARGSAVGRHAIPQAERGHVPLPLIHPARHEAPADPSGTRYPLSARDPDPDPVGDTDPLDLLPVEQAPEIDPFADTGSLGLGKFNLGTVPASVTPPVTWRRAAWFSVLATAGVLVALVSLSTALMGPPRPEQNIGLPGVVGGAPYPDVQQPNEPWRGTSDDADQPATTEESTPARTQDTRQGPTDELRGRTAPGREVPRTTATGSVPDEPAPTTAPTTPPSVTVAPTTRPLRSRPPVSGERIAKRTISYYRLVTSDPEAAYALTDGQDSPETIARRYAGVRQIQVDEVYADPNTARTVNQVTIVREDGRTLVQQRSLSFTWDTEPRIAADS